MIVPLPPLVIAAISLLVAVDVDVLPVRSSPQTERTLRLLGDNQTLQFSPGSSSLVILW